MLNATDLANTIVSRMNRANNPTDAHNNFIGAVKSYLVENFIVNGSYVGFLPGTPPISDPANGNYTWKATSWDASGDNIRISAQSGFDSWRVALLAEFNKVLVVGACEEEGKVITSAPSFVLATTFNIDFSDKPNNLQSAMEKVSEGIIDAIKATMNPITVTATSTNGGTGTVTFGAIE